MYVYNYIYKIPQRGEGFLKKQLPFQKQTEKRNVWKKMQLVGKKCLERRVPVPVVEIRTLHTDLDRKIALLQKGMLHH